MMGMAPKSLHSLVPRRSWNVPTFSVKNTENLPSTAKKVILKTVYFIKFDSMKQYIRPWLFIRKTIMCFLLKFQPFCPLQRNEVIAASGGSWYSKWRSDWLGIVCYYLVYLISILYKCSEKNCSTKYWVIFLFRSGRYVKNRQYFHKHDITPLK